jgi:hypothetical protein
VPHPEKNEPRTSTSNVCNSVCSQTVQLGPHVIQTRFTEMSVIIKGDELLPSEVKLELGPPRSRSQAPGGLRPPEPPRFRGDFAPPKPPQYLVSDIRDFEIQYRIRVLYSYPYMRGSYEIEADLTSQ